MFSNLNKSQRITRSGHKNTNQSSSPTDVMEIEVGKSTSRTRRQNSNRENLIRIATSSSHRKSLLNLEIVHSLQKANTFAFKRQQGEQVPHKDRQWILRIYWWMKGQARYREETDFFAKHGCRHLWLLQKYFP